MCNVQNMSLNRRQILISVLGMQYVSPYCTKPCSHHHLHNCPPLRYGLWLILCLSRDTWITLNHAILDSIFTLAPHYTDIEVPGTVQSFRIILFAKMLYLQKICISNLVENAEAKQRRWHILDKGTGLKS